MKNRKCFKRVMAMLLAGILLVLSSGCASMKVNKILENLEEEDMDCTGYDFEKYTEYYWEADVIYNEAAMPLKEEDGSMKPIPLMYHAEKILAVRDYTLGTLYEEGKDYKLEDGCLVIPEGSAISILEYSEYYPPEDYEGNKLNNPLKPGTYSLWCEKFSLHEKQIAITYVHADKWEGSVPPSQGNNLPITLKKLENKEPVKILIYGDSIATGADSSANMGIAPNCPNWISMMEEGLKKKYGYEDITIVNNAVGGTDSSWGATNAYEQGKAVEPDLAIIAFGMNDISTPPLTFADNILRIMDTISLGNSDCAFILVATMLPNPEAGGFSGNQPQFLDALKGIEYKYGSYVVADMTTLYQDMLANKRYWDMSANNINHPNDFLARAYTQLMLKTLEKA